jgi:hypothetical protein
MTKLAQVGHLLDIPLELDAVVEGRALRANGRRVVRMVNFKGKS